MWQIPARRSARVGEANGLNQPHSECRETKLTERKTGDQVGRASGFAPSSGSRRGYSCADPVLTELEFEVKPTNIRHTHIPPSPFPSASSATTAALPLAFCLSSVQNFGPSLYTHREQVAWTRTCLSAREPMY